MTVQHSTAVRNARLDAIETTIGTAPVLRIRTGAQPANCAASRSGTVLATVTLPSDWMAAASGGSKSMLGTWSDSSADATGTAAHYEIMDSTLTTCHEQGNIGMSTPLTTSALTAANGNVLTFASTTGVSVGMTISGTGVATGATVIAVTSTTVTMSLSSTAGVASSTSITFGGDMTVDNTSFASGQPFTVTAFTKTAAGA